MFDHNDVKEKLKNGQKYQFGFCGLSMVPLLIEDRNTVVIEQASSYMPGDVVLFERGSEFVLHRIIKIEDTGLDEVFIIKGDNCVQHDIVSRNHILGKMTAFEQKGKLISVNNPKYLKYVKKTLKNQDKPKSKWGYIRDFFLEINHNIILNKEPRTECGQYLYKDFSGDTIINQVTGKHKINRIPTAMIIENGIILPRKRFYQGNRVADYGGVLTEDHRFIPESREYDFGGYYKPDEIAKSSDTVIYLGRSFPHFGVIMIDFMRRLYYRYQNNCNGIKLACCGVYSKPGSFGNSDQRCWELLQAAGIEKTDVLDVRTPTQFKRVIIPEPGFEYDKSYFDEFYLPYKYAFDRVPASTTNVHEKIYLSRLHAGFSKEAGESIFEKFFRNNGFYIMYPDELSIKEQISVLKNAKIIASVEGTISHNILFCNKGTEQIIIRKDKRLEPRHFLFNELMHSKATYIDAYCNYVLGFPRHYDIGPFCLIFNKNMRNFAKDNGYTIPSLWFLNNVFVLAKFLLLCIKRKLKEVI